MASYANALLTSYECSFEWWETGTAPAGQPTIVSRLNTVEYWHGLCSLYFPSNTFGLANGKNACTANTITGGWSAANTTRLMYSNGELDVWRSPTMSSEQRPGGPLASTEQVPVFLIPGGTHCSDLDRSNWEANAGVKAVVDQEVAIMVKWVGEFYEQKHKQTL